MLILTLRSLADEALAYKRLRAVESGVAAGCLTSQARPFKDCNGSMNAALEFMRGAEARSAAKKAAQSRASNVKHARMKAKSTA